MSILLLNGPNLNLLGTREPHIYGAKTLSDIETDVTEIASSKGVNLQTFQSNHEGAIVDRIHAARGNTDVILINPGAFTHTSVAIRDALLGVQIPFVEIHLSNVHAPRGVIVGLGAYGYEVGVEFAVREVIQKK
ncbi:unnamed protein product [Penicillium pancosmium]